MTKTKRIRISKIENKMLNIGCELSKIESLSRILYFCLLDNYDLLPHDPQYLAFVLQEQTAKAKKRFNKVEEILNI